MLLYYPQDTTPEMGPTGLIPYSHLRDEFPTDLLPRTVSTVCDAGGCYLVHYDLWHRRLDSTTERDRFLVKFEMTRRGPPVPTGDEPIPDLASPVWAEHWAWLHGLSSPPCGRVDPNGLGASDEMIAHAAAYESARCGPEGVAVLAAALATATGLTRHRAAHGLAASRTPISGPLAELFAGADEEGRQLIAFALGENEWSGAGRAELLVRAARDPAASVRAEAVEALGMGQVGTPSAVEALARGLGDENDEVRFRAALALARIGPPAADAVPELRAALRDRNRYVRGFAVEALDAIGTPAAWGALIPFLKASRWCHHTTRQSLC